MNTPTITPAAKTPAKRTSKKKPAQPAPAVDHIVHESAAYANGFGKWRAALTFTHPLSKNNARDIYSLDHHWTHLRRRARKDIVDALVLREQKTNETTLQARTRISLALPPLIVIEQPMDSTNMCHSITFGEA